jgi:hypothetical protein
MAERAERRKGLGPFIPGDPPTRKNSASIRRFLYDVVLRDFASSPWKAAKGLTQALNTAEDRRAYRKGFSQDTTFRVLSDQKTISFNELDSVGLHYRVPISLVLIFTQLRSEMKNFGKARAIKTIKAFKAATAALELIVENSDDKTDGYVNLSHDRFEALRNAYLEAYDEGQPPLI